MKKNKWIAGVFCLVFTVFAATLSHMRVLADPQTHTTALIDTSNAWSASQNFSSGVQGPTAAAFDNSTTLSTDAYTDNNFKGPSVTGFRDDFITFTNSGAVTTTVSFFADSYWNMHDIAAAFTPTAAADATFLNPGVLVIPTGTTSGNGAAFFKGGSGVGIYGALGSNGGWEWDGIFKIASTATIAVRYGIVKSGQFVSDPPTDGMYVEYDTANTGNTDTKFTWVTRSASTSAYGTTGAINADTNYHHFKIRSVVAGTILFSVDGGTEYSTTTDVSTGLMTVFFQVLTRTTSAATLSVDFVSFMAATGRS